MEIKLNLSKEQRRTLNEIVFKYVGIGGFSDDPAVLLSQQMLPIYEQLSTYCAKAHSQHYQENDTNTERYNSEQREKRMQEAKKVIREEVIRQINAMDKRREEDKKM
jgi:hypothetical protein